jgi:hypothetical protein
MPATGEENMVGGYNYAQLGMSAAEHKIRHHGDICRSEPLNDTCRWTYA